MPSQEDTLQVGFPKGVKQDCPRPGRPFLAVPTPEAWRSKPLDKHVESLKYDAALLAHLTGQDLLPLLSRSGKKDASYIRSQAITFGIFTDKASQGLDGSTLSIHVPANLLSSVRIGVQAQLAPLVGGDTLGTSTGGAQGDAGGPHAETPPK